MDPMTKKGTRYIIVDTSRHWPLEEVRSDGRPIWGGLGCKPLCGSQDSMQEIAKGLRKAGYRVTVRNVPDGWQMPPPII